MTVDGVGHSPACSRVSASPPRSACVGARPVVGGRRSAVARSPGAHRLTAPLAGPLPRDRPGTAALAVFVRVSLAAPRARRRAAATARASVSRLDLARLGADRIVEIGLHGAFCAPQPASDLGDRQALLVAVVARESRGAASLANAVCHEHLRKGKEGVRTDGSLLPTGADDGTCVLAARLAGQPRNRSSSSPRRRILSDVPDGRSGPKRNPFGRGLLPWGWSSNGTVDVASVEGVGRRPRPCGGVATICHIHDTTSAGADVVVVRPARRESVSRKSTARVSPPATAAPSPLLLPGWLSAAFVRRDRAVPPRRGRR